MRVVIPHLSYSRMTLWERSKSQYYKKYILGEKYANKYTAFGKWIHSVFEDGVPTDDPKIEKMRSYVPTYPTREKDFEVIKEKIPLLIKLDGTDLKKKAFGDIKTGKKWSQKDTDESDQITFYAFVLWLKTGKIFKSYIHWIQTDELEDGLIVLTGYAETFETTRTIEDFLKLWPRIQRNWKEINEFTIKEYAKI